MTRRSLAALLLALAGIGCASGRPPVDRELYARAVADQPGFRAELEESCTELVEIDQTIGQAIAIGAPIYNVGSPLGCFRIYEGAAYKLLYRLEGRCPKARELLRSGLAQAEAELGVEAKAWTLRRAFDAILGDPTSFGGTRL